MYFDNNCELFELPKTFTEQQKVEVKNCLQEISNSYTRIEAEQDHIKEIIQKMADEFEMNERLSSRMAKIYHNLILKEKLQQMKN